MASKQTKQLKKRKRRERDNRRQRLFEAERRRDRERHRAYRDRYPEFLFDTTNGDAEFVEVVKTAMRTINFDDASVFQPWEMELYRTLKRDGTRAVMDRLLLVKLDDSVTGRLAQSHFLVNLGHTVLSRIPESERERYLPINDVMFLPHSHHIRVIFRCLLKAKGQNGTVYYSRRKPTLEIDRVPKIVAFSRHAIDRICERIKPRWKTHYAALGDVFAVFDQCMYFERCDLRGGQLGFTFYDGCQPGFVQYCYVKKVLGEENLDPKAGRPYYRVGYCPAVIEGDFIKATTFLFPGYSATPEYGRLLHSSLPWPEKRSLVESMTVLDAEKLYDSQDFGLIKWFHDHGVPQVVQLQQEVFAPVK